MDDQCISIAEILVHFTRGEAGWFSVDFLNSPFQALTLDNRYLINFTYFFLIDIYLLTYIQAAKPEAVLLWLYIKI